MSIWFRDYSLEELARLAENSVDAHLGLRYIEIGPDFQAGFEAARDAAQPFVRTHGRTTTLHIKKEARQGKLLVDIYRNRPSQTIVSPYSVRGRPGAPVWPTYRAPPKAHMLITTSLSRPR